MAPKISQTRLKEVLNYNPSTGVFVWRKRTSNRVHIGDVAGVNANGYISIGIDGNRYRAHVLAWLYIYGYFPENDIDHINNIKSDNRINNIRHVSRQCNIINRGLPKNNKHGVKGVYYMNDQKLWRAEISINGKNVYLGKSKSFISAVKKRYNGEIKYNFYKCREMSSSFKYLKKCGAF